MSEANILFKAEVNYSGEFKLRQKVALFVRNTKSGEVYYGLAEVSRKSYAELLKQASFVVRPSELKNFVIKILVPENFSWSREDADLVGLLEGCADYRLRKYSSEKGTTILFRSADFMVKANNLVKADNLERANNSVQTEENKSVPRVLIIDDSSTMCKILEGVLKKCGCDVVGVMMKAEGVEQKIAELKPTILTVDINMEPVNGAELLRQLVLKNIRVPAIIISALTPSEGSLVLDALEWGAVDYVQKPTSNDLTAFTEILNHAVHAAIAGYGKVGLRSATQAPVESFSRTTGGFDANYIVAIGASTGGTEAIRDVLVRLPKDFPPIVIVQHIPEHFSLAFAKRLNNLCEVEVCEAHGSEELRSGTVYIAPGGRHMKVIKQGSKYFTKIFDAEPVNRHKPSVDVLFESVAELGHKKVVAALLTGMGKDGARGLKKIFDQGHMTICQDEASCVVYGMPGVAVEMGAARKILPLMSIAQGLIKATTSKKKSAA